MDVITETEKAYLAGLIDGEGCITIAEHKNKRTPTPIYHLIVVITSIDGDILRYWADKTSLGNVRKTRKGRENERDCYVWWLTSRQAEKLLRGSYDYLMIKRSQADIAFKFLETLAPMGGWGQKGGTRGGKRTPSKVILQRQRYKEMLTRMKGYKTTRGRPKDILE